MTAIPLAPLPPDIAENVEQLGAKQVNLYRALAHAPELLRAWINFAWALRGHETTERRLRELMILRTATLHHSAYEWHQHRRMASEAGATDYEVAELEMWRTSRGVQRRRPRRARVHRRDRGRRRPARGHRGARAPLRRGPARRADRHRRLLLDGPARARGARGPDRGPLAPQQRRGQAGRAAVALERELRAVVDVDLDALAPRARGGPPARRRPSRPRRAGRRGCCSPSRRSSRGRSRSSADPALAQVLRAAAPARAARRPRTGRRSTAEMNDCRCSTCAGPWSCGMS